MFSNNRLTKFVAAGSAAVVLAAGGIAIGNSGSSTAASGTSNATQTAAPGHGLRSGQAPQPGQASSQTHTNVSGNVPANWNPGDGTIITGATADKVKAAALAQYPGTVNRVLQLSDGTYAAHYFNTSGPHHVFVSKDFKVTGAAT
jgi:hypothetical protein